MHITTKKITLIISIFYISLGNCMFSEIERINEANFTQDNGVELDFYSIPEAHSACEGQYKKALEAYKKFKKIQDEIFTTKFIEKGGYNETILEFFLLTPPGNNKYHIPPASNKEKIKCLNSIKNETCIHCKKLLPQCFFSRKEADISCKSKYDSITNETCIEFYECKGRARYGISLKMQNYRKYLMEEYYTATSPEQRENIKKRAGVKKKNLNEMLITIKNNIEKIKKKINDPIKIVCKKYQEKLPLPQQQLKDESLFFCMLREKKAAVNSLLKNNPRKIIPSNELKRLTQEATEELQKKIDEKSKNMKKVIKEIQGYETFLAEIQ